MAHTTLRDQASDNPVVEPCADCNGHGEFATPDPCITETCPTCRGTGESPLVQPPGECQWFHNCHGRADFQVEHPTLGWVDTCAGHRKWLGDHPSPTMFVPPMVARKLAALLAAESGVAR